MCAEVDVVQVRVTKFVEGVPRQRMPRIHTILFRLARLGSVQIGIKEKLTNNVFIRSAKTTMNRSRKEGLETTASVVKHYSEVAQNHLDQVLSFLRTSTLIRRNKSQIFSNLARCLKPNSRQVVLLRDLGRRSADRGQTTARKFPSQA